MLKKQTLYPTIGVLIGLGLGTYLDGFHIISSSGPLRELTSFALILSVAGYGLGIKLAGVEKAVEPQHEELTRQ